MVVARAPCAKLNDARIPKENAHNFVAPTPAKK